MQYTLLDLPFSASVSRALWEIKVFMSVVVFIYAFFNFRLGDAPVELLSHHIRAIAEFDGFTDAGRSRARNVAVVATIASTHIQILQLVRSDTERQDD